MNRDPSTFPPELAQVTSCDPPTAVDPVLLEHPLFQQLVREYSLAKECIEAQKYILDRLATIFREFGVASGASNPEECEQSLRAQLGDAGALYKVMRGEIKASELLGQMEKFVVPEIFGAIVLDLSIFLAPRLQKFVQELSSPVVGVNPAVAAAILATGLKSWKNNPKTLVSGGLKLPRSAAAMRVMPQSKGSRS